MEDFDLWRDSLDCFEREKMKKKKKAWRKSSINTAFYFDVLNERKKGKRGWR